MMGSGGMDHTKKDQAVMDNARIDPFRKKPVRIYQARMNTPKKDPAKKHSTMMSPTTDNLAMLVIFLMLLCFLPLSNATCPTTNDISLKVLRDTILSKLEDMDYMISSMDGRIRQMDITIKHDIKKQVSAIEAKVEKIEAEVIGFRQGSSQGEELEGSINDLVEDIKQDRNSLNTAISALMLSTTTMATKMDNINHDITKGVSQEISSIKNPIEQLQLVTNTTLKEIQIANRESNSELKNDLESLKTELIGVIIQSNATLGEIKVVQDGMNVCNTIAQNISLASDLISGQLEKVQETFKGDLTRFGELLRSLPKQIACPAPWVNIEGSGCLLFSSEKVKWDTARSRCKERGSGSDLAIITSSTQRQAVANHIKAAGYRHSDDWWIGGNVRSGQWEWIDGQPITEGWGVNEPDGNSGDYCLFLYDPVTNDGNLWDYFCTNKNVEGFICQK